MLTVVIVLVHCVISMQWCVYNILWWNATCQPRRPSHSQCTAWCTRPRRLWCDIQSRRLPCLVQRWWAW